MNSNLYTQIIILFHFFITGMKAGFIFDIFRSQRRAIKTSDIVTAIQDFLYWLIVGVIIVYTINIYTNGEVRGYMFIGIILGALLYFGCISKIAINILSRIFNYALFPFKKFNKLINLIKKD